MSIILLEHLASDDDVKEAKKEYKSYIKITADIEKEIIAIGGEYHADAEEKLLKLGANQENIWGGGLNLETGEIETNAIINIRTKKNNPSAEILDLEVREKFINMAKKYLKSYVK